MQHKDSLKEKILVAAQEVFAQKGSEGAKVSEIAERAGCSPSALYKHFRNIDEIHSLTRQHYLQEMIKIADEELPFEVSIADHLRWKLSRVSLYFANKRALFYSGVIDEMLKKEFFESRSVFNDKLHGRLQKAIEAGELRDMGLERLMLTIGGFYSYLSMQSLFSRDEMPNQEEIDFLIDLFLRGAAPRKSTSTPSLRDNAGKCAW